MFRGALYVGRQFAGLLFGPEPQLEPAPSGPAESGAGASGPDGQLGLSEYLRRFGRATAAPADRRRQLRRQEEDLLLAALALQEFE
jgi:hypothetical protein